MSKGITPDLQTPQEYFDRLNEEFGFTLDAAASSRSAKCPKYYSPEENGLEQSWEGETVFCHPPGDDTATWAKKCMEEGKKLGTLVVLWVAAKTDAAYFHDYILGKSEIRYLKGRFPLQDPDGNSPGRPACGTLVAVYRGQVDCTLIGSVYEALGTQTMTAAEIAAMLEKRGIRASNNSVAARLSDLQRKGLVRKAGRQRCSVNNHTITAWKREVAI